MDDGVRKGEPTESGNTEDVNKLIAFSGYLRRFDIASDAPSLVDARGFTIHGMGIAKVADHVCRLFSEFSADGLAIDCNWLKDDSYGEKLWKKILENGLRIDRRCVVFLSEFLTPQEMAHMAEELGLDEKQVRHKDPRGYQIAAEWLNRYI